MTGRYKVMQSAIRSSAVRQTKGQRSAKKARPALLVDYARDRQAFMKRKRLGKVR